MAKSCYILLGVLILCISISAAPSEVEKPDDIVKEEKAAQTLDGKSVSLVDDTETDSKENQRQKRWYSNFGFATSFNPGYVGQSSFGKRVETFNNGYDFDDPFVEIHRRLQDISNVVRQPSIPQFASNPQFPMLSSSQFSTSTQFPSSQFPFYLPVVYVPQSCSCPNTNENTPADNKPPVIPDTPAETPKEVQPVAPDNDNKTFLPDTPSRLPELEDERQNFGLLINETEIDEGEDVGRPISFDPIRPKVPMSRPPPPVEHGSSQGQADAGASSTPAPPPPPPAPPALETVTSNPLPDPSTANPLDAPNSCDGAVLSCCHQLQVTYDCFALQGCPDPTSYGNPCDSNVILRVIDRFQRFYGQRNR